MQYIGGGETTSKVINLSAAAGTVTIDSSGTTTTASPLILTANLSISGNTGANNLTLGGIGVGEFGGAIANSSGTGSTSNTSVTKSGVGTWKLSGTNTYSGRTTVSDGTLLATKAGALPGYSTSATASNVLFSGGTVGVQVGGSGWTTGQVDTLLTNATKTSGALGIDTTNADLAQWTTFTTTNFGSALGLSKLGANTLTLNSTNTYAGKTTVSAGTLLTTQAGALPGYTSGGNVLFSGGTVGVQVGGSGWTTTQVNTLLTNATKTSGALAIDTTNGDLAQWAAFTTTNFGAALGLAKLGANTLTLNATNTYAGATTVDAGKLLVNGTNSGTGAVTVGASGTLGGTGSIAGAVNVSGTLAPGASIESLDTGNLTLDGTSTLDNELGRSGTTPVSDLVNVTGSVTINSGANLKLTKYTGLNDPVANDLYFLISNDGGDAVGGTNGVFTKLNGVTTTLNQNSQFSWNGLDWKISYEANYNGTSSTFTGGNDVAIQAVPEPSSAIGLLGVGSLMALRRKKRS